MEPALDERGDSTSPRVELRVRIYQPQWSPLSTSGATNGVVRAWPQIGPPQWSPLSTSGATGADIASTKDLTKQAAMEPALDERGDWPRRCRAR